MRQQRKAAGGSYLTAALLLIALVCLRGIQLAAAQSGSGSPDGRASGSSDGRRQLTAAPKLCINNSESGTTI
jgi:hypothetical protein